MNINKPPENLSPLSVAESFFMSTLRGLSFGVFVSVVLIMAYIWNNSLEPPCGVINDLKKTPIITTMHGMAGQAQRGLQIRANDDRFFEVDGFINSTSFRMILDSGASYTILPKSIAQQTRVRITEERFVIETAGGLMNAHVCIINELAIPPFIIQDIEAACIEDHHTSVAINEDNKQSPTIYLGMNVLRLFHIDMLYPRMRLTINPTFAKPESDLR